MVKPCILPRAQHTFYPVSVAMPVHTPALKGEEVAEVEVVVVVVVVVRLGGGKSNSSNFPPCQQTPKTDGSWSRNPFSST